MNWNGPFSPRVGRSALGVLSVLALLASAYFPLGAQAETVYETEKASIPGTSKPSTHNPVNNPSDESSAKAHSSGNPPSGENANGSGESNKSTSPGVAGDGSDNGQSSQAGGSQPGSDAGGKQAVGNVGESKSVGDLASANTSPASDDGGSSSPLVPILIAIAILAAISVGVVFVRQRRQDGGPGDLTRKAS